MLNLNDNEILNKANRTGSALVNELCQLAQSDNPLLADIMIELLAKAQEIELRLKRINLLTHKEKNKG